MTDPLAARESLSSALHAVFAREPGDAMEDEEFGQLALDIFGYQYSSNMVFRAYCDRHGSVPEAIGHWTDIPAVPTDAFKAAVLLCGDPADAVAVFRTSGTTKGTDRRGQHYFRDLTLYDHALGASFRRHLMPDGESLPILSLISPPAAAPDSSLSHMIGKVVEEFGDPESRFFADEETLDLQAAERALREAAERDEPVALLGTSLALIMLLDHLRVGGQAIELPDRSRLMDTGGFKGLKRSVTRESLYAGAEELLGIPGPWCVNEYGMTEMSSQFYDAVAGQGENLGSRMHRGPAWVRTIACDPEALRPLPTGEVGVLRHWDLANLDSVMVLQTADLGRVTDEGVELLGRAEGAQARGCSLATEELLSMNAVRQAGNNHLHEGQPG